MFEDAARRSPYTTAAREGSDRHAQELYPGPGHDKEAALAKAYSFAGDEELFSRMWVRAVVAPEDVPGYHAARTICAECGEGISFGREVQQGPQALCLACAGHGYYEPA